LNGNVYRDAYDLMVSRIGINDKFVEATVGTELIDENADKFLIDTTAVKFRLPLVNGERTLVSTYKDGTTWYNCYSDGWVEQGALVTSSSVTFLFPFIDANYSLTTSNIGTNGATSYEHGAISSRTSTGFTWMVYDSFKLMYKAIGHSIIPSVADYNCGNYLFFKLADEVPSTIVDTQQIVDDLHEEAINFKNECSQKTDDCQNAMNAILALGSDYICGCMIPDYTTSVSTTTAGTITMPYHAFVRIYIDRASTGTGTCDVSINDKVVANMCSNNYSHNGFEFYVKKGDVVKTVINGLTNYSLKYWRLSGASAE
jgi:hypothetical protein